MNRNPHFAPTEGSPSKRQFFLICQGGLKFIFIELHIDIQLSVPTNTCRYFHISIGKLVLVDRSNSESIMTYGRSESPSVNMTSLWLWKMIASWKPLQT